MMKLLYTIVLLFILTPFMPLQAQLNSGLGSLVKKGPNHFGIYTFGGFGFLSSKDKEGLNSWLKKKGYEPLISGVSNDKVHFLDFIEGDEYRRILLKSALDGGLEDRSWNDYKPVFKNEKEEYNVYHMIEYGTCDENPNSRIEYFLKQSETSDAEFLVKSMNPFDREKKWDEVALGSQYKWNSHRVNLLRTIKKYPDWILPRLLEISMLTFHKEALFAHDNPYKSKFTDVYFKRTAMPFLEYDVEFSSEMSYEEYRKELSHFEANGQIIYYTNELFKRSEPITKDSVFRKEFEDKLIRHRNNALDLKSSFGNLFGYQCRGHYVEANFNRVKSGFENLYPRTPNHFIACVISKLVASGIEQPELQAIVENAVYSALANEEMSWASIANGALMNRITDKLEEEGHDDIANALKIYDYVSCFTGN